MSDAIQELISGVRTVNFSNRSRIEIGEDKDVCFWQRQEWIEWILELAGNAGIQQETEYLETKALQARVDELQHEVDILRLYGNKDCTAMADDMLKTNKGVA